MSQLSGLTGNTDIAGLMGNMMNQMNQSAAAKILGDLGISHKYTLEYFRKVRQAILAMIGEQTAEGLPEPPDEIVHQFVTGKNLSADQLSERERNGLFVLLERYRCKETLIFVEQEILRKLLVQVNKLQIEKVHPNITLDESRSSGERLSFKIEMDGVRMGRIDVRIEPETRARIDVATSTAVIPGFVRQAAVERAREMLAEALSKRYAPRTTEHFPTALESYVTTSNNINSNWHKEDEWTANDIAWGKCLQQTYYAADACPQNAHNGLLRCIYEIRLIQSCSR